MLKFLFILLMAFPTLSQAGKEKNEGKAAKGVKKVGVMLDPGHGGEDDGTHSIIAPIYREKNINLATARLVEEYLQDEKITVASTRSDDSTVSLANRVEQAKQISPNIFVSIHYNAALSTSAHGIEVFYYSPEKPTARTEKSKALAETVLNSVIQSSGAKSRGVKHGNFAVIRDTQVPAILVECGFMTNANEMNKIKTPAYMKKIASGIAKGIVAFLAEEKK